MYMRQHLRFICNGSYSSRTVLRSLNWRRRDLLHWNRIRTCISAYRRALCALGGPRYSKEMDTFCFRTLNSNRWNRDLYVRLSTISCLDRCELYRNRALVPETRRWIEMSPRNRHLIIRHAAAAFHNRVCDDGAEYVTHIHTHTRDLNTHRRPHARVCVHARVIAIGVSREQSERSAVNQTERQQRE